MAIDCNVIRDLLPLYCDHTLSVESQKLVEEHMKDCEACAGVVARMQEKIELPPIEDISLVNAWKGFHRALKRTRIQAIALGIVIALLLVLGGSWAWEYILNASLAPIPITNIEISNLCQTQSGVLLFHMNTNGYTEGTRVTYTYDLDQKVVYVQWFQSWLTRGNRKEPVPWSEPGILLRDGVGYSYDIGEVDHDEVSELRVGTPEEYITIWETGMIVPPVDEATDTGIELG